MSNQNEIMMSEYATWRDMVIAEIHHQRLHTMMKVNVDTLAHYHYIGSEILRKQKEQGWGTKVIDLLSQDLQHEFPMVQGYSPRNLKYMRAFAAEYPDFPFVQVPLAQNEKEIVQVSLAQIPWYHHISLMEKVKDLRERAFYIENTARNGWSRDVMLLQVSGNLYERQGKIISNFKDTLPAVRSDLAQAVFKDPYNFDFIDMTQVQYESDLENQLTTKISDFLLEMGRGFAFVGRQYNVLVDGDEYKIDLLMYHLHLHCYVVVELKVVDFMPEFISKLNFYISAVDAQIKRPEDNPTIGLLLCKSKSETKVKYSLRGLDAPLGVAEYQVGQIMNDIHASLPTIEEIENKLNN